MRRLITTSLSVLLAACGLSPVPSSLRSSETAPQAPEATAVRDVPDAHGPPARGAATIAPLLLPSRAACTISSGSWSGSLRLRPGGVVYGVISDGAAALTFPEENVQRTAIARVADATVHVLGVVDQPELFMKEATAIAGFVVPRATTALSWAQASVSGRIEVSLDVSAAFEFPLEAREVVDCAKLAIVRQSYEAQKLVAPDHAPAVTVRGAADLMLAPGTPPIARLKSGQADPGVLVATRGAHSRIVLEMGSYFAFGWVPSSAVGREAPRGGAIDTGRGAFGSRSSRGRACTHALDLIAEVGGERAIVGTLRANSRFELLNTDDAPGFVGVRLMAGWFRLAPGAKLQLRAGDLTGC